MLYTSAARGFLDRILTTFDDHPVSPSGVCQRCRVKCPCPARAAAQDEIRQLQQLPRPRPQQRVRQAWAAVYRG